MKIGIVGSRRRNDVSDYLKVVKQFEKIYSNGDTIVSGGCPTGGDNFAEKIARAKGIPITIYSPKWQELGKCAGFVRNTFIAQDSDALIACVAEDRKGGTEDTIKKYLGFGKNKLYLV